jgi:hypothetical protein
MNGQIAQINKNAMEILVASEIEKQIKKFPETVARYINKVEVATYALNRLPPLYASCEEGLEKQKTKGIKEYKHQIQTAVSHAFAAVQRDLLRISTPIVPDNNADLNEAQTAFQEIANYFPNRDLSWNNFVKIIKPILNQLVSQKNNLEDLDRLSYINLHSWNDSRYSR